MTKKYHISKETGRPNICRAKTPQTCTAEPAFHEQQPPHFENKTIAQQYIEEKLQENNSVLVSNKKNNETKHNQKEVIQKGLKEIAEAWQKAQNNHTTESYVFDGPIEDMDTFLSEELPDFKKVRTIEKIDYINEHLCEKDNQYYQIVSHGGEYSSYTILSYESLLKKTKPQLLTNAVNVDKIEDEELFSSVKELSQEYDVIDFAQQTDGSESMSFSESQSDVVLEREDGTKLYGFNIVSEGDSSLVDVPSPVKIDIELYENDERQNGRMMDKGYALYDTRLQRGFVATYRDSSESGGGDYRFEIHNGSIKKSKKDPGYQSIYAIHGTGEFSNSEYFTMNVDYTT